LTEEGHDYGYSKRIGMYKFFAKHLGLSLDRVIKNDGSIDEGGIVIEAREKMLVFNKKYPRPKYAVKSIEWNNIAPSRGMGQRDEKMLKHPKF
jgi:hypothetical protein